MAISNQRGGGEILSVVPDNRYIKRSENARPSDVFCDDLVAAMPWMRRFAIKLTNGSFAEGDDLVQQTIVRALEKHTQFAGDRFSGWLITIMRSIHLNQCASKKRARLVFCSEPVELSCHEEAIGFDPITNPITTGDDFWLGIELRQQLAQLSSDTQRLLLFVYGFGWTYREVADNFHMKEGTIRSRVSRARTYLRDRTTYHEKPRTTNVRDR